MALDPREILNSEPLGIELPPAPLAGTRKQRIQRLQVGLMGLAAMLMLVGFANIIISSAQQNQVAVPEDMPPVTTADVPPPPPRDPLADAGVVPELPVEGAQNTDGDVLQPGQNGPADVPPPPIIN